MGSPIQPVATTPTTATAPNAANPTTAGAIASAHSGGAGTNTVVKSLEDLKRKSPEVYQKMMEGIGMNICNEMKAHQDRLKKLMREATDQR
jgi:hypothetical protein